MVIDPRRARARELAAAAHARGDEVGWFDALYREAADGTAVVPWADRAPNPHVIAWLDRARLPPGRALDVGCGLGDNAAALAARGWQVDAVDVAAAAVAQAATRWAALGERVRWHVADLRALPVALTGYDLIVECYTLQCLPPAARAAAAAVLPTLLAPGGTLLVVARGREPDEPAGALPWPLTRAEIEAIAAGPPRLAPAGFEDFLDDEAPPVRRLRAAFTRPRAGAAG